MIEKLTDGKQTADGKFARGNSIGKQFPPGTSGNPSGRPKTTRLTDALREQLAEISPEVPEKTIAERIARALIREAISGNVQAIREIGDRTEGKPKQAIDLDVQVSDWKTEAAKYGLSHDDIVRQLRPLIEQFDVESGDQSGD